MNSPCEKTEVITYIKNQVDRIDSKVDLLLEDRNKMKGFIVGITGVVTVIINVIIVIFKK